MPVQPNHTEQAATGHGLIEDIYALFVGIILLSVGLVMLSEAGLVTGGVAGIALILSYQTGLPIGLFIVGLTLPSLALALRTMGRAFAIKNLAATVCLAAVTAVAPRFVTITDIDPGAAGVAGGSIIGMGALALARHGAATGGSGVIILWLYRSRGWNAGRTQMVLDGIVLAASTIVISPAALAWSLIGLLATSGILMVWHRPGRYTGY